MDPKDETRRGAANVPNATAGALAGARSEPAPSQTEAPEYDLLVIHASADAAFVREYLLPALHLSSTRVLLVDESTPAPPGSEIASHVSRSRFTVVVLSPAYVKECWAAFGEQLAACDGAADGHVLPLRLLDCELPISLKFNNSLDFRDRAHWDTEATRLRDRMRAAPGPDVEILSARSGTVTAARAWMAQKWLRCTLALLTLLAGVYLLQLTGVLGVLARTPSDEIRYTIRHRGPYVTISGHAAPFSFIKLGYDDPQTADRYSKERQLAVAWADRDGRFEISCSGALFADRRPWLRQGFDERSRKFQLPVDFFGEPPAGVAIAYFLSDRHALWVAGTAPPARETVLEMKDAPADCPSPRLEVDAMGMFDAIVPCPSAPSALRLGRASHDAASADDAPWCGVEPVADADLPLERTVSVQLESAGMHSDVAITLPKNHPRFQAAVQGLIRPDDFINTFVGPVYSYSSLEGVATTIDIHGNLATVRYQWNNSGWRWLSLFYSELPSPIARHPFLTGKDTFELRFDANPPRTYVGLLPTELSVQRAVWRGPIAEKADEIIVDFDPAGAQPSDQGEPTRPRDLQEFIRSERSMSPQGPRDMGAIFVLGSWQSMADAVSQTLFALVPFVGLLWISRRTFVGATAGWSSFIAGAQIVGAWICWPFLYRAYGPLASTLTQDFVSPIVQMTSLRPSGVFFDPDNQLASNTFAFVLVAATALLPWVLLRPNTTQPESIERSFAQPRSRRRRWMMRTAVALRIAPTALAVIAAVLVIHVYREPRPVAAAIADFLSPAQGSPAQGLEIWQELVRKSAWAGLWVTGYLVLVALAAVASRGQPPAGWWRRGLVLAPRALGLLLALTVSAILVVILAHARDVGDMLNDVAPISNSGGNLYPKPDHRLLEPIVKAGSGLALLGIACLLLARLSWWLAASGVLLIGWLFLHLLGVGSRPLVALFPQLQPLFDAAPRTFASLSWWFVAAAALLGYPAIASGLRDLAPARVDWRYRHLVAVALVSVAALGPGLPVKALIVGAAIGLSASLGLVVARSVVAVAGPRLSERPSRTMRGAAIAILLAVALTLAWPHLSGVLDSKALIAFAYELRTLALYLPVVGFMIALLRASSAVSAGEMRLAGVVFFAVFMVGASATWIRVIPVPFIIGLVFAHFVLFRSNTDVDAPGTAVEPISPSPEAAIRKVVAAMDVRRRMSAVSKSLSDQVRKMTLAPDEYDKRMMELSSYLERHEAQEGGPADRERAIFARGMPGRSDNARVALQVGAALAAGPFVLALYRDLPRQMPAHPFAMASLVTFFASTAAPWLLTAFFIGYFLPDIRGQSGLTKGFWVFLAFTTPFVVYRFVEGSADLPNDPSKWVESMKVLAGWVLLMLLFCTTLGLLILEYRILRRSGFGARQLLVVHQLPVTSAYVTTLLAALLPTIARWRYSGFKSVVDSLGAVVTALIPK